MQADVNTGLVLSEVEVSLTSRCTLACHGCGFFVPRQPEPATGDPVEAHAEALTHLASAGVRIGSLAIMGGEVTLYPARLLSALSRFRQIGNVDRFEVVTNGLGPQGLPPSVLSLIDRLSISDYGYSTALLNGWREYVARHGSGVELVFRGQADEWDAWDEVAAVDQERATEAYETCWYRRHCVTIERGRLFACSRVPKLGRDAEGILLTAATTARDIDAYLRAPTALPSCATCGPVLSGQKIKPGLQPDDRLRRLEARAVAWLQTHGTPEPVS